MFPQDIGSLLPTAPDRENGAETIPHETIWGTRDHHKLDLHIMLVTLRDLSFSLELQVCQTLQRSVLQVLEQRPARLNLCQV